MGPAGWALMGSSMLSMFPEHTALGKVGGKISKGVSKIGENLKKIFSDKRLKHNIVTVGNSKSGIPIKEFSYSGKEGRYRGVISEDVPWATSKDADTGYDMVDYSKIDVSFEKIK